MEAEFLPSSEPRALYCTGTPQMHRHPADALAPLEQPR